MASGSIRQISRLGIGFALLNLCLVAIAGMTMRLAFVVELPWVEYKHVLHAHSHMALLGWATMVLFALFHSAFVKNSRHNRAYVLLFILLELSSIAMVISFAIDGYGFASILSSSLFILLSYGIIRLLFKDMERPALRRHAQTLARTALIFYLFSTLFLWAIGPVIGMGLRHSSPFYLVVQAFLHFQINGWFVFAVLALVFQQFAQSGIHIGDGRFQRFYVSLGIATFLTYALAVAWTDPEPWVFAINSTGVLVQVIALFFLLVILRSAWPEFRRYLGRIAFGLLSLGMLAFGLKIIVQTLVVLPFLATIAYTIRYFVMGFLHLILLGFVTMSVFGVLISRNLLNPRSRLVGAGLILMCLGFIGTELLLFVQGVMAWGAMGFIPQYYLMLFLTTCLLPAGALLLAIAYPLQYGYRNGR